MPTHRLALLSLFVLHHLASSWFGLQLCSCSSDIIVDVVPFASTERETWKPHIRVQDVESRSINDRPLQVLDIADILR